MLDKTRLLFTSYLSTIASLNGVSDPSVKFSVAPAVEQRFEEKLKETIEFLGMINVENVPQQSGQTLGLETTRPIAGRVDTSGGTRRNPTDPTDNGETNSYNCLQTNFDWSRRYDKLDAWRHRPEFEQLLALTILRQQGRDLIMAGWNGTSRAATTDIDANPLLQDLAEGWLHKIRTKAPGQVFNDGSLTVKSDGTNNAALKKIYVKSGVELYVDGAAHDAEGGSAHALADYTSLDALVLDAKRLLPDRIRNSTDLVVIVGSDLVDDKYFNIAQSTGDKATEVEATDRILRSTKTLGGLQAIQVPYFPANAVLITRLANLSIYNQEGTRRRRLADEPEYDRIANYESVNMDYVVEDYEEVVLVENIVLGVAPARPAP
jgi:hypothetical protein